MNYCENRAITTIERDKARDSWDMLYGTRNTLPTFRSRVQFPSPAPIILGSSPLGTLEATVRHIKRRKCYADNKKEKRKNMASSPLLNFSRKIIPNYS